MKTHPVVACKGHSLPDHRKGIQRLPLLIAEERCRKRHLKKKKRSSKFTKVRRDQEAAHRPRPFSA